MYKIEEFCDDLLRLGYEKITIDGYKRILKKFLRENQTEQPSKIQAEQYLLNMRKKDYSFSHLRSNITIIRKYMTFIRQPIQFEYPRRPQTLPIKEILTEGEIARMFAATKNNREKVMISLLHFCGLRNKEVCNLKVKDIDFENKIIKVIGGKFKKDRIVPMSSECFQSIFEYIKEYPRENNKPLITTLCRGIQYSGWALRKMVKKIAKEAHIKKRVYPHVCRHSWITHLLERGCNIIAVQHMAGHANISTTMGYTHFSAKKIQQEFHYFMPNYL